MVGDRRLIFVRKWLSRAQEAKDPFDCFFSAWIALVVAAQRVRDRSGQDVEEDSDRQRVVDYFLAKRDTILRALQEQEHKMKSLARRRGTGYHNPIVDTGNQQLRDLFGKLSRHYTEDTPMAERELIVAVAELLNKVRNNVFHGIKVYDDREDLNLLKLINPILLAVLVVSEGEAA